MGGGWGWWGWAGVRTAVSLSSIQVVSFTVESRAKWTRSVNDNGDTMAAG